MSRSIIASTSGRSWWTVSSSTSPGRAQASASRTAASSSPGWLIADGATNKKVGEELDISERTVKGHLSNVFQKLGVADRMKLLLYLRDGRIEA